MKGTTRHTLLSDEELDRIAQENFERSKIPAWVYAICALVVIGGFYVGQVLP